MVSGTINIDKDSLNLNALTTKLIIDNSVGDKVKITNDQVFEIVEKNIIIEYDVCNEFNYFENFNMYNASLTIKSQVLFLERYKLEFIPRQKTSKT